MSTTVISQGFIGVLLTPIGEDDVEEIAERLLDNDDSTLTINSEGLLLVSDSYKTKPYSQREFYSDLFIVGKHNDTGRDEFIAAALAEGFPVAPETVQPYTCVWYNGSDSPVDLLTKDDFLAGNT